MGKIRPISTLKVIKILEKNGFVKVRSRKHTTFKKFLIDGRVLTTWVPHGNEVSVFVLQYIIKQTGILKEEFLV